MTRISASLIGAVALGGAVGAVARYGLEEAFPHSSGWPVGTFLANLIGCTLIGLIVGAINVRGAPAWARPLLVTGFLGGLTTFSTFSVETVKLLESQPVIAISYLATSTIAGVTLVVLGLWLARKLLTGRGQIVAAGEAELTAAEEG